MGERWSQQHEIQSDNSNFKRDCKLSTLLEWMQRAADAHLAGHGILLDHMIQQGMAWMLVTVDLEIMRMPHYGETLIVETWHKGSKGVQWFRDFQMFGADRELLAEARTVWVLVDMEKRRIMRASAFPYEVPANLEDSVGAAPPRVELPAEVQLKSAYEFTVRQSSIDMNGHMNNARIAELCMDAIPMEQLNRRLSHFRITYHQEAVLGQQFTVLHTLDDMHESYIRGVSLDGIRYFEAHVTFDKLDE